MIAKGTNLPDEDHVMPYVPWTRLRRDEDDNVIGFLAEAFQLRQNEQELSLNWLEYFDGTHEERSRASVNVFRNTRTVGKKSAFGIGNVGKIKKACSANGARVRIVYDPEDNNPAHSVIRRLPRDELVLLEALAADCFIELVLNADVRE